VGQRAVVILCMFANVDTNDCLKCGLFPYSVLQYSEGRHSSIDLCDIVWHRHESAGSVLEEWSSRRQVESWRPQLRRRATKLTRSNSVDEIEL